MFTRVAVLGGGEEGGSDLVTEAWRDGLQCDSVSRTPERTWPPAESSLSSPSWHCCRCRNLPRLNLVVSAEWCGDSLADTEAARTMVRDWAMLGTCSVSQPPGLSSFSKLCWMERLEEDIDSSTVKPLPSGLPSIEFCRSVLLPEPELLERA